MSPHSSKKDFDESSSDDKKLPKPVVFTEAEKRRIEDDARNASALRTVNKKGIFPSDKDI